MKNESKPLSVTASKLLSSGFWVMWRKMLQKAAGGHKRKSLPDASGRL
jgi:hypothetical protein